MREGLATTGRDAETALRRMFDAAVASALPARCVPGSLPARPRGRTIVVGAGKAAAAMASAVEQNWSEPLSGLVITRYGHAVPCRSIEVIEAGHPVPDLNGVQATTRILELVSNLSSDDLVICLISGGSSALLCAPPPQVSLMDKQVLAASLVRSGASIDEINCVRKHVSAVKGGRLALAAAPAKVVTLVVSDVPGDDLATIGSGPTVADPTTRDDAAAVLRRYKLVPPISIAQWLARPDSESPKAAAPGECHVLATPQSALEAAARVARDLGYAPLILGSAIEGEAREIANSHAAVALEVQRAGRPIKAPCVLLSGGEATVTVRGTGRGGPNAEFALSLAIALDGAPGIRALVADTDGIDGTEANAGAIIGPDTLDRGRRCDLSASEALSRNDAYTYFERIGALLTTGATTTNVNDFRAVLIDGPRGKGELQA